MADRTEPTKAPPEQRLVLAVPALARAFGIIMALGGIGAAAGPLIGGLITTGISWRAAFVFQALVIAVIVWLSRGIEDPLPRTRPAPSTPAERSCPRPAWSWSSWASWRRTTTSG
ncbi:MFS transporter [Streptomyces sp. NPDC058755]|uniref:MFS transporter n=1 Tax=Streptomyces sp. NPDC058755 TaxID=3346624 RepID=UPI003692C19B